MQSKGSELDFYFFCVAFWLFIRTLCGDLFVCRSFAMALAAATFPAIGGPCRRRQDLWCSTGAVSLSMCVFQCTLFLPSLPSNDCDHHQARIATHILLSPALPMCSKKVCTTSKTGHTSSSLPHSQVDEELSKGTITHSDTSIRAHYGTGIWALTGKRDEIAKGDNKEVCSILTRSRDRQLTAHDATTPVMTWELRVKWPLKH